MTWAYGPVMSPMGTSSTGYNYIAFPDQQNMYVDVTGEYLPIIEIAELSGTSNAETVSPAAYRPGTFYFDDVNVGGRPLDFIGDSLHFWADFSNRIAYRDTYANLGSLKLQDRYGNAYKTSEIFPNDQDQISFNISYAVMNCYGGSSSQSDRSYGAIGDLDHPFVITFTLKQPPTFEYEVLSIGPYYKGLSEYEVNVSDSEAKVGGYIENTELYIQYTDPTKDKIVQTKNIDPTISITLNETGTVTPKLYVRDSRGQKTKKTLPSIEVLDYSFPEIWNSDVIRCDSNGVQNDEGTYALITVQYKYNEYAAESLVEPIVIKNISDNISNHVSWYTSYDSTTGVSNKITFPYAAPDYGTIYGLVDYEFDKFTSYEIWTRLKDSLSGESETYKDVLSLAYYTVDFLAGGYGIAFGKASEAEGFECNMDSAFSEDINLVINPGTSETDYNLDNVIRRLDWDKDLYPELYIDEVDPLILPMSQSQHGGSHQISVVSNELVDESNLIWEVTGPNRAARIENGLLIVEGNEADESIVHVTVKYNFGGHMLQDSIDVLPQWRLP